MMADGVVRSAVAEDAEAVAGLRRAVYTYKVMSTAAARHSITVQSPAERFLALVAEVDGQVVAWGSAGLNTWTSEPGHGILSIYVHPERRKQGIASDLSDRLHQHLVEVGAQKVQTFAQAGAVEFARNRGYEGSRAEHYAGVDTRSLPEPPLTPEGIRLAVFDQLSAEQLYVADAAAAQDRPDDAPDDAIPYDEWLDEFWHNPGLDKSLSVAALAGDEIVCFTAAETDGDRAWSGMTGTIPAYRGRGLAKVVKSDALRRCADAGITAAYTSNDDENGPMLAVNNWLGYRRVATEYGLLRQL